MKNRKHHWVLIIGMLVLTFSLFAQEPDLSRISSSQEKVSALLKYCEWLRINNSGNKDNYLMLQQAAFKGLALANPADGDSRSQLYFYAALGYYYHVNFESAQYYFYKSLQEAQKQRLALRITRACVALIPVNFQLQQQEKVDECKNILLSIVDTTKTESILQDGYYALGSYYQQKSYYSTAQNYFIKSLQIREKTIDTIADPKKKFDYAIQCDMLSKLYLNTQMTDKSLASLRRGSRFANVSPQVSNRLYSSFVEAYTSSGAIDSALIYNSKLEAATRNSNSFPSEIISSDLNIGIYYLDHKDFGKADLFINKGDSLARLINSPMLVFQAQMIKGRYFEETGMYDKSISLLSQALPTALQFSKELSSTIYRYLALAQKGKGNLKEAVRNYENYVQLSDSLSREKLSTNFADQETRYETNQKETQIVALNKENQLNALELQNASRTRAILILGLAALGMISLLLYFIYRNKEKSNQLLNERNAQLDTLNNQLALANETKAKLFGIISHDLRSPISQIVQLLRLQKENPGLLDSAASKRNEEQLKIASENVLETMEDLLLWSKSQMQHFLPQPRKSNISEIVEKELRFIHPAIEEKNITVSNDMNARFTLFTDENFVSIMVRNLLQNAVKFSEKGDSIRISNDKNNLYITNNASRISAEKLNALLENRDINSQHSGLGLQIANDLAKSIQAAISFRKADPGAITAMITWNTNPAAQV